MKITITALFIFTASCAWGGDAATFEDWAVGSGDGFLYAGTMNNNEEFFGEFCYSDGCSYIVGIDVECTTGKEYAILINTDIGASTNTMACGGKIPDQTNFRYFLPHDQMSDIVAKATTFGFAMPMQKDQFRASRFSLKGAQDATNFLIKRLNERENNKKDSISF